jgi:GNAT superfamily N-acetyltransferase
VSPDGITTRAATPADLSNIMRFVRGLAEYEKQMHACVASDDDIALALFGAVPRAYVLFAELHGRPAGLALWFHTFHTFTGRPGIYLEDLFVDPAFRRLGIARALLGALARLAVDEGCNRVDWSVLNWNEPALRFYASLGAEPVSQWTVQRLSGSALAALAA